MIAEFALIPDVFAQASYNSPEACDRYLRELKEGILSRGVVRNLRAGNWWNHVEKCRDSWDKRGRELLKKLKQQGRLCDAESCTDEPPMDSAGWCAEALASHEHTPLSGIIADESTAAEHPGHDVVAPASKLTEQTWWLGGKNSVELKRSTEAYLKELGPTLRHSNAIMFIDPHLDPTRDNYIGFVEMLKACGTRTLAHRIEIHRVCYSGSGRERQIVPVTEWRQRFDSVIGGAVRQMGLHVEVFLWDDFHDRYLISNLIGILIPNGFDTESNPSITRWARLDREHRDSVEKEFDPAFERHRLLHRFML